MKIGFALFLISLSLSQFSQADVTVINRLNQAMPYTVSLPGEAGIATMTVIPCDEERMSKCDGYHAIKTKRLGRSSISYPAYSLENNSYTIVSQDLVDSRSYEFVMIEGRVILRANHSRIQ